MALMTLLLATLLAVPDAQEHPSDPAYSQARSEVIHRAFPDGDPPFDAAGPGSRDIFFAVLDTDLFAHGSTGPFDVWVMRADDVAKGADATLDAILAGLEPLVPVIERQFPPHDDGLVGGQRWPLVFTDANVAAGQTSFDDLIALLEWCEDDFSGWLPVNKVWTAEARRELVVRTWEVQLMNLADERAEDQGDYFYEHGIGYYTLAHMVAKLLKLGAKSDVMPPWLSSGLVDELDIEAYGEAWVGGDWWEKQTSGWYRPGWSGFLPDGAVPPPPPPPPPTVTTVKKTGDSWQHRAYSGERHWENLVADRKAEAPASFLYMANNETFYPRDRAYTRCMFHLLIDLAPPDEGPGLLQLLDHQATTPPDGMPDCETLPTLFSEALSGVPEVVRLDGLTLGELLDELGMADMAARIQELGAGAMLAISDHRDMSAWLFQQSPDVIGWEARTELWSDIQTAEWWRQYLSWRPIGEALDRGMAAALAASKTYPKRDRDQQKVRKAFWEGLRG